MHRVNPSPKNYCRPQRAGLFNVHFIQCKRTKRRVVENIISILMFSHARNNHKSQGRRHLLLSLIFPCIYRFTGLHDGSYFLQFCRKRCVYCLHMLLKEKLERQADQ